MLLFLMFYAESLENVLSQYCKGIYMNINAH